MRTIKFRALKDDMSNCRFYYGSMIYDKENNPRIYDVDTNNFHTCIKGTEGQFTGLYDKNGKEIYEGDVLKTYPKISSDKIGYDSFNVLVKFINSSWIANGILGKRQAEISEVIGNIHENPELLTD